MYQLNTYIIDFDKVKTIDDIKIILKEMKISNDNPSDEFKKLSINVDKENLEYFFNLKSI